MWQIPSLAPTYRQRETPVPQCPKFQPHPNLKSWNNALSLSLSFLQVVNPSGDGSATWVILLQSSRSSTSTEIMLTSFKQKPGHSWAGQVSLVRLTWHGDWKGRKNRRRTQCCTSTCSCSITVCTIDDGELHQLSAFQVILTIRLMDRHTNQQTTVVSHSHRHIHLNRCSVGCRCTKYFTGHITMDNWQLDCDINNWHKY